MIKLTFDIETVPQQNNLSDKQKEYLEKKLKRLYPTGPTEDEVRKTKALSPYLGQIVCIGYNRTTEDNFSKEETNISGAILDEDEKVILERWWNGINERKGDFWFISYNGLSFDVPYIIKRSFFNGIRPLNRKFLLTKKYQTWPHFDVAAILADWDPRDYISLDFLCDLLNLPSPKDGEINAEGVEQAFREKKFDEIEQYCLRDVLSTYEIFKKIQMYQPRQN